MEKSSESKSKRIAVLVTECKELRKQLLSEKRMSNVLIQLSMDEAEDLMEQEHKMMREADNEKRAAESSIIAEKKKSNVLGHLLKR